MLRGAARYAGVPLAMLMVLTFASATFGQEAGPPPDVALLKTNESVWVTTTDRVVVRGRFRAWSDSRFEWDGPSGLMVTPLQDIQRIEARDPVRDGLWRGALIGAGAGAVLGLLIGSGLSCEQNCGEGYSKAKDIAAATLGFALIAGGEGALIGVVGDAVAHRRRPVYVKRGSSPVAFGPVFDGNRLGAAVVFRW